MKGKGAVDQRQRSEDSWHENQPAVFKHALKMLHNIDDAEDVTQTVYLRYFSFREKEGWKAKIVDEKVYQMTIATHLCYEIWRRRREEATVSYDDDNDERTKRALERKAKESDDTVKKADDRLHYEKYYRSLPLKVIEGGLSEYELNLLQLNVVEEMSPKEIAELLGGDSNKVRYQLQKIHAKIRYRTRQLTKGNNPFRSE